MWLSVKVHGKPSSWGSLGPDNDAIGLVAYNAEFLMATLPTTTRAPPK